MNLDEMLHLPAHLLRRANQVSTAFFAIELADEDLTAIQYATMIAVADRGEIDSTSISRAIGVDRATLGGVADRLERKGLLSRSPSAVDRRVKILSVSREGHALLARVQPAVMAVQERLTKNLSAEESRVLCDLLIKLIRDTEPNAETVE